MYVVAGGLCPADLYIINYYLFIILKVLSDV